MPEISFDELVELIKTGQIMDQSTLNGMFNEKIGRLGVDLKLDIIDIGPFAHSIGWSFEQTVQALDFFYGVGLGYHITEDEKGINTAGISLRAILFRLINPTNDALLVLDRYNISPNDVDPKIHSFKEILTLFSKKKALVEDIVTIFGVRGGADFWMMINSYEF